MSLLVRKEVRLLLPALVTAVALGLLGAWLRLPFGTPFSGTMAATQLFWLGLLLLGISSVGREISFRTMPLMLAQPLERERMWWTKMGVLAGAVALACAAECLQGARPFFLVVEPSRLAFPLALVAGCLWLTLFLRQVIAAFWLALLIPAGLELGIGEMGGGAGIIDGALYSYALGGFFLARWLFLRAQDTAWGGEALSIKLGTRRTTVEGKQERARRPWAALVGKEFRLQQMSLAGMFGLLVLDFAGATARRVEGHAMRKSTELALETLAFLWWIVPAFVGCQSVAEERKMGVMETLLCLPVSRRAQWFFKLMFALIVGGWLSATLFWALEAWAGSPIGMNGYWIFVTGFVTVALIGFYASTLAWETHQALAMGVCVALGIWGLLYELAHLTWQTRFGALFVAVEFVAVSAALLALSYKNMGAFSPSWRLGARTFGVVAVALVCGYGLAVGTYERVWEFALPEAPPGPARFSLENPPKARSHFGFLALVLPDGRLWTGRWDKSYGRSLHDVLLGGKILSMQTDHFAAGSNWVDAALTEVQCVGIQSDGTAWVSEKDWHPMQEPVAPLLQLDKATNWRRVYSRVAGGAFLLKDDETLWSWSGVRGEAPRRVGTNADWDRALSAGIGFGADIFAWKNDGSAWSIFGRSHAPSGLRKKEAQSKNEQEFVGAEREKQMDGERLRAVAFESDSIGKIRVSVREDGTLWIWESVYQLERRQPNYYAVAVPKPSPSQIGIETNWTGVVGNSRQLRARKRNGTLWTLKRDGLDEQGNRTVWQARQIGKRSDWLALGLVNGGVTALAADGSLWRWPTEWGRGWEWSHQDGWSREDESEGFLRPSRRPELIGRVE